MADDGWGWYEVHVKKSDSDRTPLLARVYTDANLDDGRLHFKAIKLLANPQPDGDDAPALHWFAVTDYKKSSFEWPNPQKGPGGIFTINLPAHSWFTLIVASRIPLLWQDHGDAAAVTFTFQFDEETVFDALQYYWSAFNIDGNFDSHTTDKTLSSLLRHWYGNAFGGDAPALFLPAFSRLLHPGDERNLLATAHSRQLYFEIKDGCSSLVVDSFGDRWHPRNDEPGFLVQLWPFDLIPFGHRDGRDDKERSTDFSIRYRETPQWDDYSAPIARWKLHVYSTSTKARPFPPSAACDPRWIWNERIAKPYLTSLRAVKGTDPVSVLPLFESDNEPQKWRYVYYIDEGGREGARRYVAHFQTLRPFVFDASNAEVDGPSVVDAALINFRTVEAGRIPRRMQLQATAGQDETRAATLAWDLADLVDPALPRPPTGGRCRVGSIDLCFAPPATTRQTQTIDGHPAIQISLQGLFDSETTWFYWTPNPPSQPWIVNVDADLQWHLAAFAPGDEDPSPLERSFDVDLGTGSLLIDAQAGDDTLIKGDFLLVAHERSAHGRTQSLGLRLERLDSAPPNANARSLILINARPFLICQVQPRLDFGAVGEIGTWSGGALEGPSWNLAAGDGTFDLLLPPQAIGEEMIKSYDTSTARGQDPASTLAFKFSPNARLRLLRSSFEQSFMEAPWNVRRLLGYPGQRQPGAAAVSLDFELLYGLSTKVTTPRTRVAEMDARLGRLPETIDEVGLLAPAPDALAKYAQDYAGYRALLGSRLAMIEPYRESDPGALFTSSAGVSYRLRAKRETADPIDPESAGDTVNPRVPLSQGGLRGGVDWGFESHNILDEIVGSGPSSSGQIDHPSFTALGGAGHQKASFAHDKSTIYSDTFLGRTFFYSLERIGRIGVLWNRAKYVVVYERSCVASEQFPNPGGAWEGRPVVRKVREYVELLERERYYPEFGASPATNGFVAGARFAQKRYPVDATWGHDVPDGWVLPLWIPSAGVAYPFPDVQVQLATAAEQGAQQAWAKVANPEVLTFFTSTRSQDGVDTNAWPPFAEVDYPRQPMPTLPESTAQPARATDDPQPDPPARHVGYDKFTLLVDSAGRKVNLLAGRAAQATEALIENVTLARRNLAAFDGGSAVSANLHAAVDRARQISATFSDAANQVLRNAFDSAVAPAKVAAELGSNALNTAVKQAQDQFKAVKKTAEVWTARQQKAFDDWSNGWDAAGKAARADLDRAFRHVPTAKAEWTKAKAALDSAAAQAIAEPLRYARMIDLVERDLRTITRRAADAWRPIAAELKDGRDRLVSTLQPIVQAKSDVAAYRAALLAGLAELQAMIAAGRERMTSLYASEFGDALDRFAAALAGAGNGLYPDVADAAAFFVRVDLTLLDQWIAPLAALPAKLDADMIAIAQRADEIDKKVRDKLAEIVGDDPRTGVSRLANAIVEATDPDQHGGDYGKVFDDAVKTVARETQQIYGKYKALTTDVTDLAGRAFGELQGAIDRFDADRARAQALLGDLARAFRDWPQTVAAGARDAALAAYRQLTSGAVASLHQALDAGPKLAAEEASRLDAAATQAVQDLGDSTMRLLRCYGSSPVATAMQLSRARLAYYFHEINQAGAISLLDQTLHFTPSQVLVNRLGRELDQLDLKTVGVRLPSFALGDRFLPNFSPSLALKDLLPDFAGINLEALLKGVTVPDVASDHVKVTHGFDPTTLKAWAQVDIDFPLADAITIFQLSVVEVRLSDARFQAHSRIAVNAGGAPQRSVNAKLSGDFALWIAGSRIVTLHQSAVRFDESGHLKFDIGASNVELNDVLKFVSEMLSTVSSSSGDSGSGLTIQLIKLASIPTGVRARLAVALPAVQTGAFSMSNLSLSAYFTLSAQPGDFGIGAGISLASRDRPFNMSVLFLGGGGWITANAHYRPFSPNGLSADLSIGLAVGASVPFDIGIASGGVYFLVSLSIDWGFGGAVGGLAFMLRIALSGELSVLGLISISILLALEAHYQTGGSLYCQGILKVSIKIGWFIDIDIEQGFTLTLAGGGGGGGGGGRMGQRVMGALAGDTTDYVDQYVSSFGGDHE